MMHATTTVRVEDTWQPNSLHLPPSRFESGSSCNHGISFPCFAPAILGVHALLYKNTQPHRFGVSLASVFCTSSIYSFTSIDHDLIVYHHQYEFQDDTKYFCCGKNAKH
ncbi:hypothetical protein GUJ93_ZPchr0012g21094 [Zizania palustris]|uniref:Uncharacterized protein n=1 Tax=Zizania palustris TaxID=103762 RepID=A0A8J5WRQ1_ZIZPA|nr:hypothetical protein GUJ93_ZPchr0012g21094 [Zizania palustris]